LEECFSQRNGVLRSKIEKIIPKNLSRAKSSNSSRIMTQSIERLISRGFVVGYGIKTMEKLYITRIKITQKGLKAVKAIRFSKQKKLPLKLYEKSVGL